MKSIQILRSQIDKIDEKIDKLLLKRAQKVLKIKALKKSQKLPITDVNREKEIFSKFSSEYEIAIFKGIVKASKKIQQSSSKSSSIMNKK